MGSETNGCCWKKVYSHDANGSRRSGDLDDLVDAIKEGADVKVQYRLRDVLWNRTCTSVTMIGNRRVPIVSGIITDIPDTQIDSTTGRTFNKPFAYEWMAFNTTGRRHMVKFNRGTSNEIDTQLTNLGMTWFVRGSCLDGSRLQTKFYDIFQKVFK